MLFLADLAQTYLTQMKYATINQPRVGSSTEGMWFSVDRTTFSWRFLVYGKLSHPGYNTFGITTTTTTTTITTTTNTITKVTTVTTVFTSTTDISNDNR